MREIKFNFTEEIELRDNREREYDESEAFGPRMLNMYHQVLGTGSNNIGSLEFGDETPKKMLRTYKEVILNDKDGSIIEAENRLEVLRSLENSINSMGYPHLTEKELDKLKPSDANSFLICPKGVSSPTQGAHQIGIVTKKDKNGDFILSTVDKSAEKYGRSQVYTYTIGKDKSKDLSQLLKSSFTNRLISYSSFLDNLREMSKHNEAKPYKMARQKAGNCHIKEVEAGLKYALWSRKSEGKKVKWPISTLDMHEKFTKELVEKLEKLGYSGLIKVIEKDFEEYKLEKREINDGRWKEKKERVIRQGRLGKDPENSEPFSSGYTVNLLADKSYFKDELAHFNLIKDNDENFFKEMDHLEKEGINLRKLYKDKCRELKDVEKRHVGPTAKLEKYKKLNPILKIFKRSKIKSLKKDLQQLNDKIITLKGERDKYRAGAFRKEATELKEMREKHSYLFKEEQPRLSINKKIFEVTKKAGIENATKVARPQQDMKIAR